MTLLILVLRAYSSTIKCYIVFFNYIYNCSRQYFVIVIIRISQWVMKQYFKGIQPWPGLYTCTVYHLVYVHVQYIIWFIYMYSISPGLCTCTVYIVSSSLCTCRVYHLVYVYVQYITWFIYMYSISSGLYTCTVYHLVYIHVQYITWFMYMYTPGSYTCIVYHLVYILYMI